MLLISLLVFTIFFIIYIYMSSNNLVFKMKNFSNSILDKEKVVVFDMDETLGYFVQLSNLCYQLEKFLKKKITQNEFNKILDLYPEILRPNILSIMNFIKSEKIKSKCSKVIIYTNNQGNKEWALKIARYFNYKLGFTLFDKVIGSNLNEPCRTTNQKTFSDLKRCTNLQNNVKVCFIDDLYHRGMDKQHVEYIMVEPYMIAIQNNILIKRLYSSNIFTINNKINFMNYMEKNLENFYIGKINNNNNINNKFLYEKLINFFS